jgi:hypothetical protein
MVNAATFDILLVLTAEGASSIDRESGMHGAGDIATALSALKPRRGARVLVASDTVFTQVVRLPAAQTASLSQAELESALFYEVEPFCGIVRDDATVGVERHADGEWRVSVASRAELASLAGRVQGARCRLAGVTAIPRDADAADPAAVMAALFPAGGPSATILQPPRGGLDQHLLTIVAAFATIVIALLCLCDWMRLSYMEHCLGPELAEAEPIAAENERIRREIRAEEDHVRAIAEARDRRERAIADLTSRRDRWLALLATLASDCGDRAVIRAIAVDDRQNTDNRTFSGARVDGFAANPAAAADAMARLSSALAAKGWKVEPGAVKEGQGGAATFSFHVSPSGGEGR